MVLEARAAQRVHFWENFINKLKGTPLNGGTGQVRSGPSPHPSVRWLVEVPRGLLQPWSLNHVG